MTACGTKSKQNNETASNKNIVKACLADLSNLEKVEGENPILLFQASAKKDAKMIIPVDKEHIAEVIETAKEYKHCIIITEDHTLIKLSDMNNCRASGSWGAEMPYAKGYIKKGGLTFKEDYANNIIGIPDAQQRTAYYFN